jgi:hypothetical protein
MAATSSFCQASEIEDQLKHHIDEEIGNIGPTHVDEYDRQGA